MQLRIIYLFVTEDSSEICLIIQTFSVPSIWVCSHVLHGCIVIREALIGGQTFSASETAVLVGFSAKYDGFSLERFYKI